MVNIARAVKTKFPNAKIGVSAITHREDIDLTTKLSDVNSRLKVLSERNDFVFIDNAIIDNTCLNGSKLHLNAKGSSLLATQFIAFLRSDSSYSASSTQSSRKKGFRQPDLYSQLSEILMKLAQPQRSRQGAYRR